MPYRAPFITETDEPTFTDCQFAAGLMLLAEWTPGEAILDRHGNTLDAVGLKRLRERIRVLSGDTVGGASLEDLAQGVARRFPDLPPLPGTANPVDPLHLTFDELWARLQAGHCAVLDGNPSSVSNPRSPLRSIQAKGDYGHAVFVHITRGEQAFHHGPARAWSVRGPAGAEVGPAPVRIGLHDGLGLAVLRRREAGWGVASRAATTSDATGDSGASR